MASYNQPDQERVIKAYLNLLCEMQKSGRPATLIITVVPPGIVQLFRAVPAGRVQLKDNSNSQKG